MPSVDDIYTGTIHTRVTVLKVCTYIAVLLLTLMSPLYSHAQESEEQLNAKALALFEQEKYADAFKNYSALLSLQLQNPEYNFRFGACQLFTSADKEEALKYLKFATENPAPPSLAYFYYALGLHLNYRFDKAIDVYEKYRSIANKKDKEAVLVDQYIQQCRSGKNLVSNFTELSVVQRDVLPRTDFYRNYDLSEFGGKIIVKPEDFMSEEDKKRDAKFLMYFKQDADQIYYASYSDKNGTGKDLYVIRKLPTGNWSNPEKLSNIINTDFDEDFPFIHPEGNTLYFASKGHNSMGGYDIFKSLRRSDGSWTQAVNMEFAINTPWDDFMFITDLEEKSAWFASNRETSNDQVTVYRIGMERIPLNLTLIKGVFESEGSRKAKITVEDVVQHKTIGVYEADRQLGNYLLDLKGSGKYKFLVEAEESDVVHSGLVEVPKEKGLSQFRQEMKLVVIDGKEQLQIINHFDDPITDEQLLTADILKKQASLDVNASLEILDAGVASTTTDNGSTDIPQSEQLALAERALQTLEAETDVLNNKASALYEEARTYQQSSNPDEIARAALASELASIYRSESEKREIALNEMRGTIDLMKSGQLNNEAYSAQYNRLAATKNNFAPLNKFESDTKQSLDKRMDLIRNSFENKRSEVASIEDDIAAIDEEVAYYQSEIENTGDELIRDELTEQINEAQKARPEKVAALERSRKEFDVLTAQKEKADDYYDVSRSLLSMAESKANTPGTPVDIGELNRMQQNLDEKTRDNPALLALVAPEKADALLAQNLSEGRKGANGNGINSQNEVNASTGSDTGSSETAKAGSRESDDINEQLRAIELNESQPEIVEGNYDAHFTRELAVAANAEDPIIAESRKAELYDQWAENIGLRIDSLQQAKREATDTRELVRIDDEISALQSEKTEKEDLAMESYQNIASLSDREARAAVTDDNVTVAIENQGETVPEKPRDSVSPSGNFPPSVAAINNDFDNAIAPISDAINAGATDEEKLQLASLYDQWADTLQLELTQIAAYIKASDDPEEKRLLEAQASDISELRLEVQAKSTALIKEVNQRQSAREISSTQTDLQQELYEYIDNYNASAFQQLESQIIREPVPEVRAAQLITLNKGRIMAIQNEQVRTEARINNTTDEGQRKQLNRKLEDLMLQKSRAALVLDSLESDADGIGAPSAPPTVLVRGSERFEGYVPVPSPAVEEYMEESATTESVAKDLKSELANLEEDLDETKKKKDKQVIQDQIDSKEKQLAVAEMQARFYEEAAPKLAAVESQLLTMEAGDEIPSKIQEKQAASLLVQADNHTQNARIALEDAEQIKKKKERLPAIAEAMELQDKATLMRQEADLAEALAEEMERIEEATIRQNHIVLPGQEVVLPTTRRQLNPNEKEDIEATTEFQFYAAERDKADSIRREVQKIEAVEKQYTARAQSYLEQSATAPIQSPDGNSKMALAEQAYDDFEQADSLSKISARLTREATYIENEANRALLTLPEEAYTNILAYFNDVQPAVMAVNEADSLPEVPLLSDTSEESNEVAENSTNRTPMLDPLRQEDAFKLNAPKTEDNSSLKILPDVLTNTIFELDEAQRVSQYNENNPIPVDPPLPAGLLYKVQIGAFRNRIKQDVFKGITPIVGESTPSGLTRYTAGEFKSFSQADAAKVKIHEIGYSDAFVVAYLNGERITIAQARAIEGGAPVETVQRMAVQGPATRPSGSVNLSNKYVKQGPLEVMAIENVGGTFYTVQVGVYSKPVSSAGIFNISPLYQENLSNGWYRYTTGKFDDEATAIKARDEARALGVSDAFVSTYQNGVRIAVEAAVQNRSADQGSTTGTAVQNPPATTPQSVSTGGFRIKLGTYSGEVPVQEATQLLLLSAEGVEKVTNPDGSSSYFVGPYDSLQEAEERAEELRGRGLINAQVEK